jgi:hypothetical protein
MTGLLAGPAWASCPPAASFRGLFQSLHQCLERQVLLGFHLEAVEREDFAAMTEVWQFAQKDPELESALREVHAGLIEEQAREATVAVEAALTAAVKAHLPSAKVVLPATEPVTVVMSQPSYSSTPRARSSGITRHQRNRLVFEEEEDRTGIAGIEHNEESTHATDPRPTPTGGRSQPYRATDCL